MAMRKSFMKIAVIVMTTIFTLSLGLQSASAAPAAQSGVQVGATCKVNTQGLRYRAGPGVSHAILGWFSVGEIFAVQESTTDGSWAKHSKGWTWLGGATCSSSSTGGTGGNVSKDTATQQVCFATSPQFDEVTIPNQTGLPKVAEDANLQRMFELTQHYRNSGPWVMAKASGLKWTGTLCLQARNPDEFSFAGTDGEVHTVVQALQLWGDAWTVYPSAITTGEPVYVEAGGRLVKFDENPTQSDDVSGRACTECAVHNGPFSFWPSGAGRVWQLWPDTEICRTEVGVNVPAGGVLPNQSPDCH